MRILYLMHINWFWIRQRPQILAELLTQRHSVRLMHYAMYRRGHRAGEAEPPMPHQLLHRVPGPIKRQGDVFEAMDGALIRAQIDRSIRRFRPDCLWVLHPTFEPATREVPNLRVVYDCMDDHMEFAGQGTQRLLQAERRLAARADLCLFSSATLESRVAERMSCKKSLVVNNGLSERFLEMARRIAPNAARCTGSPEALQLGYFGTISSWFDWDLVLTLLKHFPQAVLKLAGPVETPIPSHARIHHVGILSHQELPAFAAECCALLMPFKVTRLIESVDPVKLYEYVALGIPSLAPRYTESLRFVPFVQLYDHTNEAVDALAAIVAKRVARPDPAAVLQFLRQNTWESRLDAVDHALLALG